MGNKIRMLFTEEEQKRIHIYEKDDNVRVDLHYMTKKEAKRFIMNLIALFPQGKILQVVHGYTHGETIRTMLRNEKLSKRTYRVQNDYTNRGVSYIYL